MIDIERVRADTAGCEQVLHFNSAGSSLPTRQVVDAMVEYLRAEEVTGGYEIAATRADDLDAVYGATARYLNCDPSEVAATISAADGWWRAFSSVPLVAGDRILVGHSEYQANAFGWLQARERGVVVQVVPNDAAGDFDVTVFADMQAALAAKKINVSTPGVLMAQLELGPRSIDAVVRAGVHYFNTQDEVARFCEAVADL